MKTRFRGSIALLLCAFVWGMSFAAQSSAMDYIGPYTFVFLRTTITSAALFAALPLLRRIGGGDNVRASLKRHWAVGGVCGLFLVASTIFQQYGLMTTTTAKSGFITALYIIIVPILGIALHRKTSASIWFGVALSMLGLYFLCMNGDALSVDKGDALTFASALGFAVHIILIDRLGGELDSVLLSAIQFLTSAVVSGILMICFEEPTLNAIMPCWLSILYAALFSGALGYTLQIVGQKTTDPTLASLILCLEAVFAALGGWVLLNETLSIREAFGCVLMLSASVVALLPSRARAK